MLSRTKGRAAAAGRRTVAKITDEAVTLAAYLEQNKDLAELNDPISYVATLRTCIEPLTFTVSNLKTTRGTDPAASRWNMLLDQLTRAVPPITLKAADRIARVGDDYAGTGETDLGSRWVGDIGAAHQEGSTFGRKGRLLASVVRYMRPDSCVELGTGFGLSALYILHALSSLNGNLTTVESSTTRATLSRSMLETEYPGIVTVLHADVNDVLRDRTEPAQFLFHDAAHHGDVYVAHFDLALTFLPAGAAVVYDDITWEDRRRPGSKAQTHEGWLAVVANPRVQAAAEVYGLGLLLLS